VTRPNPSADTSFATVKLITMDFWQQLHKPFTVLAPMHDVTDTAFRQVVRMCSSPRPDGRGKPDVLYTEFVSIDGLLHEKSQERIIRYYLRFSEQEHPIVAQIWGNDPKKFSEGARIIESLGFDGVDINMGCPDKKVMQLGGGAAHMLDQKNALACIAAAQAATQLPVSVKTRLGFDEIDINWIASLMQSGIPALTVHLRTKKELSRVPAHWELAEQLNALEGRKNVLLIGNGDVDGSQIGVRDNGKGFDGIMVGRGILGNPWFFSEKGKPEDVKDRLKVLKLHAELFQKYFDGIKSFAMLKKHVRGYVAPPVRDGVKPFAGAKKMREQITQTKTVEELISFVSQLIS
jgi:tRNA-dihydrouridine synthase